jgi:lipoate-protein ligase A
MQYLDLSLPTPVENVALEEALLDEAEDNPTGSDVLRLWECAAPAVVLGSGCRFLDDVEAESCASDGVAIVRRASGGGTVLVGRGCMNFCLVLSYDRHPMLGTIDGAFGYVLERVRSALGRIGFEIEQQGVSDLVYQGPKVSGSGQRRRRRNVLVHGTLLYGLDLLLLERYLRLPKRQPPYRQGRSHLEFVGNLVADAELLRWALRWAWHADQPRASWPADRVAQLVNEKYTSDAWLYRR